MENITIKAFKLCVQVRGGQLWGTDVYTYDSDLVAGVWNNVALFSTSLNRCKSMRNNAG